MPEERFLTKEEAEGLRQQARILCQYNTICHKSGTEACTKCEGFPCSGFLFRAIAEATVQPGDAGWCKEHNCPAWYETTEETDDGTLVRFPAKCHHPDYREGHCLKEAK